MMMTTISCLSVCVSVRVHVGIFMKFVILVYFEKSVAKIQVGINLTRIMGTSHEHVYTFVILSRPLPLRIGNILEKIKIYLMFSRFFFI